MASLKVDLQYVNILKTVLDHSIYGMKLFMYYELHRSSSHFKIALFILYIP